MKVSVNWLKKFTEVDSGIDELVDKIGAQLGAVEEVVDLGKKYQGIVVAKVISCEKHPNADKLTVCTVDDRGAVQGVERDGNGHVQIVCGANNVAPTLAVAWIPPGVVVPSTTDKEPFKLEVRDIRGVKSNGMIASAKELALGDDHEGILIIDKPVEPGQPFAEVYELNDYIIDIENKMFTHRPDLFGMLGVAREVSGIYGKPFKSPAWYRQDAQIADSQEKLQLEVANEVPDLVPRFMVVAMENVEVKPSPLWLQFRLVRAGIKPVNNIVDATNLMMLTTAQPLHAYDYDKVAGSTEEAVLGVRMSKKDEELELLGNKKLKLIGNEVVITDGQKPIGLGGVMGGATTEVDENTKNIILEAANFDMNSTRVTARQHGLFTEAATRFTKGQSPLQTLPVIAKTVDEVISRLAGGRVASQLVDDNYAKTQDKPVLSPVSVSVEFINARLGLNLSEEEITALLTNVEFAVHKKDQGLLISAPFWRTDIEIPEDIVEEVGRLHGYDHLPHELPKRDLKPAKLEERLAFKNQLRDILSTAGANEVLTYSFVNDWLLEAVGQNSSQAYKIRNALSPELQYYRLSLTPSLLEKVHPNIKAGIKKLAIFELGQSHNKMHNEEDEKELPRQFNMLSLVLAGSDRKSGAAFYQAKAYLDFLALKLGITFDYLSFNETPDYPVVKPYEISRSAMVLVSGTKIMAGMVGEFRQPVISKLKLPQQSAGFELSVDELLAAAKHSKAYQPLPKYPKVEQDISLKVPVNVSYRDVFELAGKEIDALKPKNTVAEFEPLDIYQEQSGESKHITLRLSIGSYERTLVAEEVNSLLDKVAAKAKTELNATRL